MQYDLVIRHGMVVDGSGAPAYPADIGVVDGRIATIGRIDQRGPHVIDAAGRTVCPGFVEAMIDIALEHDFRAFFRQPLANEDQAHALEMMRHPRSVVTFSDSGAHVAQIMDASLQTHLLAHWVREEQAFSLEEAVRLVTYDTATAWGLHDRGLIREGMNADLLVLDPARVAPLMPTVAHDLPAGAKRLVQHSIGIDYTIVNGRVLLEGSRATGNLPGRLARGPLARTGR